MQRFRKANGQQYGIYWSSATGAHVLKEFGDINAAYAAHQWERGWGFPSTDETGFWWGSKQHFLNTQTGARTVAYWSAETGTHTINEKGSIFAKWASLGDAGNLGFPTTDEDVFWNGSSQHYYNKKTGSRTAIYWSAATGAHTMNEKGAIYAKWASLGDVKALGFPTTDEYTDASGTVHVKFQKGEITWTASGDTKVVYSK